MAAANVNLKLEEGATWVQTVQWLNSDESPKDFTGFTGRMQIRKTYSSPLALHTLTEVDGIDFGSDSIITLTIPAEVSVGWRKGVYVYDLEINTGGDTVVRLLQGRLTVSPEVTKND